MNDIVKCCDCRHWVSFKDSRTYERDSDLPPEWGICKLAPSTYMWNRDKTAGFALYEGMGDACGMYTAPSFFCANGEPK